MEGLNDIQQIVVSEAGDSMLRVQPVQQSDPDLRACCVKNRSNDSQGS